MSENSNQSAVAHTAQAVRRAMPGITVFLLGVLLPVITLVTELNTGMSATSFFDPIPSWFHVLLVALVPFANGLVWYRVRYRKPLRPHLLVLLNGTAIGIAGFYSLVYLPVTPIGIMLFWSGIGLLPLAPLFSLVAAIVCRRHLVRAIEGLSVPRLGRSLWTGFALALVMLIGAQLPTTITQYGIRLAASEDSAEQARGIRLLRNWGSEEELLRACYRRSGRIPDMITFITTSQHQRVWPQQVRSIYYRVTGKSFTAQPRPTLVNRDKGFLGDIDFDDGRGGDQVEGKVKDLSLASSSIDGSVDADAALAYLEWTLVLKNDGRFAEEARAQLALPPGATVSRVTLWINDEPREAAFAGKGKVRQAYQSIVRRSRDPLLVTQSAPDAVMVQMFPVPAGGEMKARIGITIPLVLEAPSVARLQLPYVREQNFSLGADFQHAVWMESRQSMRVAGPTPVNRDGKAYVLRTSMSNADLGSLALPIRFSRDTRISSVVARDRHTGSYVQQRIRFDKAPVARGVIVIDGSSGMKGVRETIAGVIESTPGADRFDVIIAGDEPVLLSASEGRRKIVQGIRRHEFVGGTDNVAALKLAWDRAATRENAAILWLHGPQPVLLSSAEVLASRWKRRPGNPRLFDLAIGTGHNRIAEKLVEIPAVQSVPRSADLKADLETLLDRLNGRRAWPRLVRGQVKQLPADARVTSDHLVRLWARDRIGNILSRGHASARKQAIAVAHRYQLVTPVSGAVVLETAQQYRANKLAPVDSSTVPTVPEPEEWAMIIISLAMLTVLYRRRQARGRLAA